MSSSIRTWLGWIGLVIVTALLGGAGPAAAGDSRWSLTGKVGQASVEQDFGPPVLGWRVDDEDASAGFEVGYTLHRFFGLRAGYHDLGAYPGEPRPCPPGEVCPLPLSLIQSATRSQIVPTFPVESEFTGWSLSAIPRWPVTERVTVYGKLGVLGWRGTLSRAFDGQEVEEPSDRELLAGLGAEYVFPRGFGVLVEYESSDLLNAVSVGASWHF